MNDCPLRIGSLRWRDGAPRNGAVSTGQEDCPNRAYASHRTISIARAMRLPLRLRVATLHGESARQHDGNCTESAAGGHARYLREDRVAHAAPRCTPQPPLESLRPWSR